MHKLSNVSRNEFLTPFDSIFDALFTSNYPQLSSELGDNFFTKGSYPKVDVVEYDDKLVLEADVAGLSKEEVSAELEGDYLIIKGGHKSRDIPKTEAKYVYREIKRSSFQRSFYLGDSIDKSGVKADYRNGSLIVELPRIKPAETKPTKIKLL